MKTGGKGVEVETLPEHADGVTETGNEQQHLRRCACHGGGRRDLSNVFNFKTPSTDTLWRQRLFNVILTAERTQERSRARVYQI